MLLNIITEDTEKIDEVEIISKKKGDHTEKESLKNF
jgi:hypothetical protein